MICAKSPSLRSATKYSGSICVTRSSMFGTPCPCWLPPPYCHAPMGPTRYESKPASSALPATSTPRAHLWARTQSATRRRGGALFCSPPRRPCLNEIVEGSRRAYVRAYESYTSCSSPDHSRDVRVHAGLLHRGHLRRLAREAGVGRLIGLGPVTAARDRPHQGRIRGAALDRTPRRPDQRQDPGRRPVGELHI